MYWLNSPFVCCCFLGKTCTPYFLPGYNSLRHKFFLFKHTDSRAWNGLGERGMKGGDKEGVARREWLGGRG